MLRQKGRKGFRYIKEKVRPIRADILFRRCLYADLSIWQACLVFRGGYSIWLIRILSTKGHSGKN